MSVPVEGAGLILHALSIAHQGFNGGSILLQPSWDPKDTNIHHVCSESWGGTTQGGGDAGATSCFTVQGGAVGVWTMWSSFTMHHQGHALTVANVLI